MEYFFTSQFFKPLLFLNFYIIMHKMYLGRNSVSEKEAGVQSGGALQTK